ncbi:RluA family pseudouridine synthase [Desulfonema magnum]|uniref:Pseudouridine synthase n=1 Tax=Desulfonema magnum TaxID=45655 RepID=A0A975BU62_9BACT|nr:RluA family pseudouridine synthase [Desulfonema magnum]QTA91804.1 Pseudouridine synthase, RluC/RluD family [Desulfonema magnum]
MIHGNVFTIHVTEHDAGKRADTIVASYVSGCSRTLAAALILRGEIRVQGAVKKPGYKLKAGDEIRGHIPPPEPVPFEPEPIGLDILYEDGHLIVINKPPGLVVHPAPGHYTGTLVNALLYHCPDLEGIGGKLRPGIVHRLDKDTSGALVVAKNADAQECLASQFKSREVKKTYLALVHGEPRTDSGVILLPIGRHPVHRKKMSTFSKKGRAAETSWKIRERFQEAALLKIRLKTGRTHQIRVHCAAIHHPVIGDDVYCTRKRGKNLPKNLSLLIQSAPRQMLHAWHLEFTHPVTEKKMCFESPLPNDMDSLLNALRNV